MDWLLPHYLCRRAQRIGNSDDVIGLARPSPRELITVTGSSTSTGTWDDTGREPGGPDIQRQGRALS